MMIIKFEMVENKLIKYKKQFKIVDGDVAHLYGVETRDLNKSLKNNPYKFPDGYVIELTEEEKKELVENLHCFDSPKHSTVNPKVFTEKGLYMLAIILKNKVATEATLKIIETFAKIKEFLRNINDIIKTQDELIQKKLADKSNKILEDIIEIEPDILADDRDAEIEETTTKFEFNLSFAKVS